jgi:hypothetical protein
MKNRCPKKREPKLAFLIGALCLSAQVDSRHVTHRRTNLELARMADLGSGAVSISFHCSIQPMARAIVEPGSTGAEAPQCPTQVLAESEPGKELGAIAAPHRLAAFPGTCSLKKQVNDRFWRNRPDAAVPPMTTNAALPTFDKPA